jgi:hypothetical protein
MLIEKKTDDKTTLSLEYLFTKNGGYMNPGYSNQHEAYDEWDHLYTLHNFITAEVFCNTLDDNEINYVLPDGRRSCSIQLDK